MSIAEVTHRARRAIQVSLEAHGIGGLKNCPVPFPARGPEWIAHDCGVLLAPQGVLDAADASIAGRFDVFALRGVQLGFPPNWLRDPRTGTVAPSVFGKSLDYRDNATCGDIKYLWEPSRHLELVTLAQAWRLSGRDAYCIAVRTLLESWFEQNPYPLGPHWTSALEHSVRLVNWAVAWQILGVSEDESASAPIFQGDAGERFRRRWLEEIYRHMGFIAGHFSRHSSANNHLFGEYMGLYIATLNWPCWGESAAWRKLAAEGLQHEATAQNFSDGVNREQGIWYHHEVADMMLLTGLASRAAGDTFSESFWQRLEAMLAFLAALMDVAGNVPMIGDSDDAVMVRLSREPRFDVYRSLLASGAVLFDRADFARKAVTFDDKTRWLFGDAGSRTFSTLLRADPAASPPLPRDFPQGGYWVLGDRLGEPDELKVVADAGPLGYLSIAAHGHADALSFTLSVCGRELLIDPGTYAYHTHRRWRDYFKGTSAHNTLRVDGLDQSVSGGNFMWLSHAQTRILSIHRSDESECLVAEHTGYRRLADPVTHRRSVCVMRRQRTLEIVDFVEARREHDIELFWHFAEQCVVQAQDRTVVARSGPVELRMTMGSEDWYPVIVNGQEDPPLGWVSRSFDCRVSTATVVWRKRVGEGGAEIRTFIQVLIDLAHPGPVDDATEGRQDVD